MSTVIVDMMGGDNAPLETVKGVGLARKELGADVSYILVGDKAQIEAVAASEGVDLSGLEIVHADSVVEMTDDPMCAVRGNKTDSSMAVALKLLKEGRGDAMVSTGNTGALFTGATLLIRRIKGVKRPALAAAFVKRASIQKIHIRPSNTPRIIKKIIKSTIQRPNKQQTTPPIPIRTRY